MLDLMGTFGEILIILIAAIILLKPQDLPRVLKFFRQCFRYLENIRMMIRDLLI